MQLFAEGKIVLNGILIFSQMWKKMLNASFEIDVPPVITTSPKRSRLRR